MTSGDEAFFYFVLCYFSHMASIISLNIAMDSIHESIGIYSSSEWSRMGQLRMGENPMQVTPFSRRYLLSRK